MKASFFETGRYQTPVPLPAVWPAAPTNCSLEAGDKAYQAMIERLEYVESIGFDWASLAEHHSPRTLTPAPIVSAANAAAKVKNLKIALLGPIVPQPNPIRIAQVLTMVNTMSQGWLVVGLRRGLTSEYLSFELNPAEGRERPDAGMELILKAWTEPQHFGWQGRYYQYRTVSVWPHPLQQPHPPTYALGTSKGSCDVVARNHVRRGVSYGPFAAMAKSTNYCRQQCREYGWESGPDHIICRTNRLLAEGDDAAEERLKKQQGAAPFSMRPARRKAMLAVDKQHRRRGTPGQCEWCADGEFCWRPRHGGEADQEMPPSGRRRGARPVADEPSPRRPRRADGCAIELFGKTALPRIKDI